jgi:hypothetical protein
MYIGVEFDVFMALYPGSWNSSTSILVFHYTFLEKEVSPCSVLNEVTSLFP